MARFFRCAFASAGLSEDLTLAKRCGRRLLQSRFFHKSVAPVDCTPTRQATSHRVRLLLLVQDKRPEAAARLPGREISDENKVEPTQRAIPRRYPARCFRK